ncbi:DUF554 domain-containing protein [Tepidibacillus infernus]|uniref:DUF554 domain-containing protein n=1 Tax=Tepidibacillus decaturensis TaxID=1413211 RepID=A0A135L7I3_9BACI|nr:MULTISPECIES: DUF554 domain-containing protein [Tepidibacillus]KXG44783.1 hypothetical protein U473_12680 [Tepidibacillus decaturensis]GBF11468.1 putative membrane protein YdfK [Tepidibacillus sp. HK-1]
MVLQGTLVNTIAIIFGGMIGAFLPNIPLKMRDTVMQGLGLAVIIQGILMGLKTENFLLVILSLVLGGVLGEILKIDDKLDQLGHWLERKLGGSKKGNISNAFVTATLVYTIGAMAILGSLNSGLNLDHRLLYLKAMLDGFSAIIFASTLGFGVVFSAVPVLIYQGMIALLAKYIHLLFSQELLDTMIVEITATGGILIIAIAINILELKKINVANMLPAIIIAPIGVILVQWISKLF